MFRPTLALLNKRATRKLKLTPKVAGKDYYKGFGTGAMGRHTKHGGYVIDWSKVRTYVVPEAGDGELTPFVSKRVEKPEPDYRGTTGPMDGQAWLARWRESGWY
ncbi:mitochondrial ribosomal protein L27-domain-containing protein [Elsinoe ampelina]|uniref:Mitochondrial ribosomal protein L27-domain-containing protein n=1 Tax=Elsinoe ampelina TaxID=302913 RepID=A0A6A6G3Z2_9PEZI|nr:mitochondrial ribosomal protein L27-domain-containing protein [Elsinoe ampelina]